MPAYLSLLKTHRRIVYGKTKSAIFSINERFEESSREMVTEELLSMVPENVLEKDVPFAAFPETWIE